VAAIYSSVLAYMVMHYSIPVKSSIFTLLINNPQMVPQITEKIAAQKIQIGAIPY